MLIFFKMSDYFHSLQMSFDTNINPSSNDAFQQFSFVVFSVFQEIGKSQAFFFFALEFFF